jgi:hypothetical protein
MVFLLDKLGQRLEEISTSPDETMIFLMEILSQGILEHAFFFVKTKMSGVSKPKKCGCGINELERFCHKLPSDFLCRLTR